QWDASSCRSRCQLAGCIGCPSIELMNQKLGVRFWLNSEAEAVRLDHGRLNAERCHARAPYQITFVPQSGNKHVALSDIMACKGRLEIIIINVSGVAAVETPLLDV